MGPKKGPAGLRLETLGDSRGVAGNFWLGELFLSYQNAETYWGGNFSPPSSPFGNLVAFG